MNYPAPIKITAMDISEKSPNQQVTAVISHYIRPVAGLSGNAQINSFISQMASLSLEIIFC